MTPPDLDRPVDLVGVGGIDGELQDALGRVGPGRHGHLREADGHRQLLPVLAAVLAAEDLAVLVARVQHPRVARIEQQRPYRQAVIRDVELLPVLPVVRAAVRTVLRADIDGVRVLGVRGDGPDGGRLGQAASRELPAVVADGHAIEAGLHGTARRGLTRQTDVHVGRAIRRHPPEVSRLTYTVSFWTSIA